MKRYPKTHMLLLTAMLALTLLLAACTGEVAGPLATETPTATPPSTETYTVVFDLDGGTLISGKLEQQVEKGGRAIAPEAENGRQQLSWDKDYSNVSSDMTVTAVWKKVELSSMEVAEIVQKSTVTINCDFYNGASGSGSGFFIDNKGTIVTSYHVIEYATSISVDVDGGGKYNVDTIVAFNELYDLAILKIKMTDSPGLTICSEGVKVGETVYANGSALGTLQGTFTSGIVSSTARTVNGISCIQMDASISSGNSGGPLVNRFGEVVGVNALSYTAGSNLNLAVKIENLDHLTNEVNYTIKGYEEWIMKETDRSYSPYNDNGDFYYSTINTYTYVTGRKCNRSVDFSGSARDGYVDTCEFYVYDYNEAEADDYVKYLKTKGFEFFERETFNEGVSYYYYNDWSGILVDMYTSTTDNLLYIWVYYY